MDDSKNDVNEDGDSDDNGDGDHDDDGDNDHGDDNHHKNTPCMCDIRNKLWTNDKIDMKVL